MALLTFFKRPARDSEACRTNALAAGIFAACPLDRHEAQMWSEVAKSWSDLANDRAGMDVRPEPETDSQATGLSLPSTR